MIELLIGWFYKAQMDGLFLLDCRVQVILP